MPQPAAFFIGVNAPFKMFQIPFKAFCYLNKLIAKHIDIKEFIYKMLLC